jgi:hypothetical protein
MTAPNRFPMPFLMEADAAAALIVKALHRGAARVDFPWPTALAMGLYRQLPQWAYDLLAKRSHRLIGGR